MYLGEALGQAYVAQVFPPESKARAQKMVKEIEAAMGRDIDAVTWMQPATKREARLKLAAVLDKIGYPDKWIDYSSLAITRRATRPTWSGPRPSSSSGSSTSSASRWTELSGP